MKQGPGLEDLLAREWLVANGIGGYAGSTAAGLNTRKYHGLLVAAMAPPVRRMVLLSRMEETLLRDDRRFALDCNEYPGVIYPQGHQFLREFDHTPFPRWRYEGDGWALEKTLHLLPGEYTVVLSYTLCHGSKADLEIRPLLAMRKIHELSYQWNGPLTSESRSRHHYRIPPTSRTPEMFMAHEGHFSEQPNWYLNQIYRQEQQRGYSGLEDLWTPGFVRFHLKAGRTVHFVCSAEPIDLKRALRLADEQRLSTAAPDSTDPVLSMLRRAAEQFIVSNGAAVPAEQAVNCIAGYPWFPPGGRDALIGFTGLLLVPGRHEEARSFLLSRLPMLRNGLLPSRMLEDCGPPVYQDADTSLWFINAVWDFLRYTGDDATGQRLLDAALQIVNCYRQGTDLGIGINADGLLASRSPGMPTSWMGAKIGEWVITPRVGRPVELNALWYNGLRIAAELCERYDRHSRAQGLKELAASVKRAFNSRFWNAQGGCCYDVIDDHGFDPSVRPNQLLAISLPFAVLESDRHEQVLRKVSSELLTPLGLRTLSPEDHGYQGSSGTSLVSRERAYHNGSAFPWLLGPYVSAMLKVHGRCEAMRAKAMERIRPCIDYMQQRGTGQLCEFFDGDSPHKPGGAVAFAPAVAELLRCYSEDVLGQKPTLSAAETTATQDVAQVMPEGVPHPA
ncbi:MAG TPA: amylo-alpha-1,6-glucosidase [Tepidisphaeraceae bacterium]|nr:amylo-alpha-1,6-glucosidase [Tepidisphaeraceae bacterium]